MQNNSDLPNVFSNSSQSEESNWSPADETLKISFEELIERIDEFLVELDAWNFIDEDAIDRVLLKVDEYRKAHPEFILEIPEYKKLLQSGYYDYKQYVHEVVKRLGWLGEDFKDEIALRLELIKEINASPNRLWCPLIGEITVEYFVKNFDQVISLYGIGQVDYETSSRALKVVKEFLLKTPEVRKTFDPNFKELTNSAKMGFSSYPEEGIFKALKEFYS